MLKKTWQRFCQVFSKQVDEVRVDKMVWLERWYARCTLRRDVPLGRLPYSQHKTKLCYWLGDASMRRLYVGYYSISASLHCVFLQQKLRCLFSHTFTDFREPCSHHPDGSCTLYFISKRVDRYERGEMRNEKWEMRNERPSGLVTLKPHKRSDLITL